MSTQETGPPESTNTRHNDAGLSFLDDHVLGDISPRVSVSVVIPAYQCAQYIAGAVESVLIQSYSDREVIVVNDGSPDSALLETALRPYRDKIRYIKQPTGGPASARNRGILEARGEHIAFLDADDYWCSDHLAKQMALLQQDPDLDLVYCDCILVKDEKPLTRAFNEQPQVGRVTFDSLLVEDCAIGTSTTVVSRNAIMRAGAFDPSFIRCEDFDMWLRMAFAGARMAYHSDAQVFHRISDTSLSADRWSMKQDRIRVYRKIASTLPVSEGQRHVLEELVAKTEADSDVDLLKHFLRLGEYSKALDAAQRANARKGSWKVRIAYLGLYLAPRLFRQLHRARAWLFRHDNHPATDRIRKSGSSETSDDSSCLAGQPGGDGRPRTTV